MNNILRNVLMRRSTMQFDGRLVRDEAMIEILEEGKFLSNAPNNQEWHFTVVQNRGLIGRFHELYTRFVKEKGGETARVSMHLVSDVPVLVMVSGRTGEKLVEDAAHMVFGSMMLVAEKEGIASCWLSTAEATFQTEEGQQLLSQLHIPIGYTPLCIGAFGYKRALATSPRVLSSEDKLVTIIK
ncbi:MAG: nitroreductase family protein [Schwartzia sp.]|nr:nitroreductase family protein [Schwartzia sp. (in: firmicutes)]MBR1886638.1 nitroreductase family protein [Schwartzia sp. (in: firmicutes)]